MEKLLVPLVGPCAGAAIIGPKGYLWCTTAGFSPSLEEIRLMASVFDQNSNEIYQGIFFQGQNYAVTYSDSATVIAKTMNSGLIICNCGSCFVFGFDEDKMAYDRCYNAVKVVAKKIVEEKIDFNKDFA